MKTRYILVLSALFALPLSSANGDALLFPYVVTSNTVASIVSVVNTDTTGRLFVEYLFKKTLAHNSECSSSGRREVDSAQNDLVSFEVNNTFTGPFAGTDGGPLFNDPATNVTYTGDDFTMNQPKPQRGYLIVDDGDNDGPDLYGEAVILETASGAAWGYRAENPVNNAFTAPNGPTFDSSTPGLTAGETNDITGEALDADNNTDEVGLTLLPRNEWVTKLFVTPLGDTTQRACADCSVVLNLTRDSGGFTDGLFDRDANPLSGSTPVNVVCVSGVDVRDLISATVEATINAQGGWGFVDIDPGLPTTAQGTTSNTENAAVVIKLEFNETATQHISPKLSNSFSGVVNSAVWLRNRDNSETF